MVSIHPGINMTSDLRHMYDIVNLCPTTKQVYTCGMISYELSKNKELSDYFYLVKLAHLDEILNDEQGNFTVFVWKNHTKFDYSQIDYLLARKLISYTIVKKKLYPNTLKKYQLVELSTLLPASKLLVYGEKMKVSHPTISIVDSREFKNGIVYILDKMIVPEFYFVV